MGGGLPPPSPPPAAFYAARLRLFSLHPNPQTFWHGPPFLFSLLVRPPRRCLTRTGGSGRRNPELPARGGGLLLLLILIVAAAHVVSPSANARARPQTKNQEQESFMFWQTECEDAKLLQVTGDISYNGYQLDEFVPEKTAAYISQYDLHIPEMTVRETLDFSSRCQGVGRRPSKCNGHSSPKFLIRKRKSSWLIAIISYSLILFAQRNTQGGEREGERGGDHTWCGHRYIHEGKRCVILLCTGWHYSSSLHKKKQHLIIWGNTNNVTFLARIILGCSKTKAKLSVINISISISIIKHFGFQKQSGYCRLYQLKLQREAYRQTIFWRYISPKHTSLTFR